jgi:hypothetical protein
MTKKNPVITRSTYKSGAQEKKTAVEKFKKQLGGSCGVFTKLHWRLVKNFFLKMEFISLY